MNSKKLEFMRRGSRVKRFHGFHLLMENPVGHHTFNLIGILMCCLPSENVSRQLIFCAYEHDLPECITGDLPAPFKRKVPGLREACDKEEQSLLREHGMGFHSLTPEEARWLKLADSLDGAMHCLEERRLGNSTLDKIFWTFIDYVMEILSDRPYEADRGFVNAAAYMVFEWEKANGPSR